ncbi:MAG: mandelate racemase/muconate lactonizing enzyme family protein [Pseudomonadota bacterium]
MVLWHKLYHLTRDYGRKGSVIAAISAIDIALWDLAGHYYKQPIYQLLGGAFRHSVQPYATGFYRLEGQGEAQRLAEEALRHYDNGFTAMKIKLGFGVNDDIEVMHSIATALGDRPVELMVDSNHAYGYREALQLGRELELFNVRWYEEPVVPEDINSYSKLRNTLDVPIAGGENEHTPYGFKTLLAEGAVDIVQPDIGSCGGITAARDIVAMAQAHGVGVNPHVWGSAVAQAASLQLLAALPVTHHNLFPQHPLLEFDCSSHPFRNELITTPWQMVDGMVSIPDGPGLGIDIVPETLERYKA